MEQKAKSRDRHHNRDKKSHGNRKGKRKKKNPNQNSSNQKGQSMMENQVAQQHVTSGSSNRYQLFDSSKVPVYSGAKGKQQKYENRINYATDARSRSKLSGKKSTEEIRLTSSTRVNLESRIPRLNNGEKGAEVHTVAESDRIKFTQLLLDFRENEELMKLELPNDITNTERKFMHMLAGQLGLKSKSYGKNENRHIVVTKIDSGTKSARLCCKDIPTLRIGTGGVNSLNRYFGQYPPSAVELAESKQTRSSLSKDRKDCTYDAGNEIILNKPRKISLSNNTKSPDISDGPRKMNISKRRKMHQSAQERKFLHKNYPKFFDLRSKLPAFNYKEKIAMAARDHKVVVISGETGCGKSTQVPQFLLDDEIIGPTASIAVTQPRRISATSLAERVSNERCERVGDTIGYQVRLDSAVSDSTQCVFLTPGILLRRLLSDPLLSEFNYIIIDEIHERDKNTEFLLICLRDLIYKRSDLTVLVMSATLQIQLLINYFKVKDYVPPEISIPGRLFPVQHFFLEDVLKVVEYETPTGQFEQDLASAVQLSCKSQRGADIRSKLTCVMCGETNFTCPEELGTHVALCDGGGNITMEELEKKVLDVDIAEIVGFDDSLKPNIVDDSDEFGEEVAIVDNDDDKYADESSDETDFVSNPMFSISQDRTANKRLESYQASHDDEDIDYDLLFDLIRYIDGSSFGDGAILVFLPGWQEISETELMLRTNYPFNDVIKYTVLPLHSGISSKDQKKCFLRPPEGIRKIILSTNIAETSVTIEDVSFVIDTGRAKEKNYDPHLNSSTLQPVWISSASAKQRAGRAGRTKAGVAFRLFSRQRSESMIDFQESELLRTPLEEICLQCKKLGVAPGGEDDENGIGAFLEKALTAPHPKSIENAINLLVNLGAMESKTHNLTDLGNRLALLSMEPRVGKMVIWSYLLGCSRSSASAGVAMSYKSPFILPPNNMKKVANGSRVALSRRSESDQITILHSLRAFETAERKGSSAAREFCRKHYLSFPTIKMIRDLKSNTVRELSVSGFVDPNNAGFQNRNDGVSAILQAAICAGLYPNVATRQKGDVNFSTMTNKKAKVHISSVNGFRGQALYEKCQVRKGDMQFIVFGELVKGVRTFTMSQTTHLHSPLPIFLFCGNLHARGSFQEEGESGDESNSYSILSVDDWISFRCPSIVASHVVMLRKRLSLLFDKFVRTTSLKDFDPYERDLLSTTCSSLVSCFEEYNAKVTSRHK